jgi:hypothetical protein
MTPIPLDTRERALRLRSCANRPSTPSAAGAISRPISIPSVNTSLRCPCPNSTSTTNSSPRPAASTPRPSAPNSCTSPSSERRDWIAQRLEGLAPAPDQNHILQLLTRADIFEHVIQSRYLGTKRFSLEGVTALIPFLDELFNRSAELGAQRAILGHEPPRPPQRHGQHPSANRRWTSSPASKTSIRAAFSAAATSSTTLARPANSPPAMAATVALHLVSNPSHLEAVDPVAMGRARARQDRYGS